MSLDAFSPGIDLLKLCKTTGWHNNCGLNCLSHFLYEKLQSGELQIFFSENPNYVALLETFQSYYQLPERPTWDGIRELLDSYPNAADREAIFSPILRKFLGKVLIKNSQNVWDTEAAGSISEFLTSGEIRDVAEPLITPNLAPFLTEHKRQFDRRLRAINKQASTMKEIIIAREKLATAKPPKAPTEENIRDFIEFKRRNDLEDEFNAEAQAYWMSYGMQRYVDNIATLENSVMVSADQLCLLGKELGIGIYVYTPDSIARAKVDPRLAAATQGAQNLPEDDFYWTLNVHNRGVHWEYEEPSKNAEKTAAHNQFYPDSFYADDPRLGEFKTYGAIEDSSDDALIKSMISSKWSSTADLKPQVVNSEKSVDAPKPSASAPKIKPEVAPEITPETKRPASEHHLPTHQVVPVQTAGFRPLAILRSFVTNIRAQRLEYRYHKLHRQSEDAMDHLHKKLQNAKNKGTINNTEKQVIFEFYYNALEEEFKKGPTQSLDLRRVECLIKELKRNDVFAFKHFVLEEVKTGFELRAERKRSSTNDNNPATTKKQRR